MPGRQITFNPLAEAELFETARWYDDRSPGLGGDSVAAVRTATNVALEAPKRWRLVRGTRRHLMGRFPFALVCREISDEQVEVVTVAHRKRRQRYWARR